MITRTVTEAGIISSDVLSDEYAKRRIYLTGVITDAVASDICTQITQLEERGDDDIVLIIQSPGGSVSAGLAILDTMQSCRCEISTVVMGEAASMGAVLASAGVRGKRFIGKNAEMMIHQPLGGVSGQATDIERTAAHILKLKSKLHRLLSEHTGTPFDQICRDCERDLWLDADEAIEYGLVDALFTGFN